VSELTRKKYGMHPEKLATENENTPPRLTVDLIDGVV
jgi:hypothetical protein